eukprot:GGOE01043289.1.p3 GENE.GGOE01043289.1~~GGOE01043289.1.p3  ORF type:complete len:173 (+),score=47.78 GGOE01043289.1:25-519(+)
MDKCSSSVRYEKHFQEEVSQDRLVFVKYRQDNCNACETLHPVFEDVCRAWQSQLPDKVSFLEVDANRHPKLAAHLETLPRIEAYHKGELLDSVRLVLPPKESKDLFKLGVRDAKKAASAEGRAVRPADIKASLDARFQSYMSTLVHRTVSKLAAHYLDFRGAAQ